MPPDVFSISEAVELGRFVLAAYDLYTRNDPADFVPPAPYTLVTRLYAADITNRVPDSKVFGLVARSGSDVVVALRGAEGIWEWILGVQFIQVPFPYGGAGRTAQSFAEFYATLRTRPDSLRPRVIEVLKDLLADGTVKTLRITGHSLGAALATLLALEVSSNGVFVSPTVYTFASPMVGDKVLAGTYDRLVPASWRIANRHDIVTQLPSRWAGYEHVDAEVPINSDDRSKHSVPCWHALLTYLNTLDAGVAQDFGCAR